MFMIELILLLKYYKFQKIENTRIKTKHKSFSRRLIVRVQEPINNLTNLITTMIVYNVTTFINISVVSGHIRVGYNIDEETFNGYPIFFTYLFKQLVIIIIHLIQQIIN
ncbi:hypothetical protein V1477_020351 [Vespula maculifrons]|uniref:Uncharacterized protein n=1 Tax=Vespula maculifrons TaxID=7453 RepID=A0ABD2ALN4_VESMC